MTSHETKLGGNRGTGAVAPLWRGRLGAYARLIRLNRPIGIFLLMWPALWALWMAGDGQPPWQIAAIFVAGVVLMRSAGCAINDFADRDLDGHVTRTSARPLAQGEIAPAEAIAVFLGLSLAAFALVLMLNWQTVAMSVVAVVLAMIYPFMKRFTHVPQVFLGMAFGWAVPMAFTAIQASVPGYAWVLFLSAVVWALIYDTEYAMVDREDDLQIGIKSTAILFGTFDRLIIALLQLVMLVLLLLVGVEAGLGPFYFVGLGAAALLFGYQQWLIRRREPALCFKAFLNNNYVGLVVFAGLLFDYLLGSGSGVT